MSKFLNYEPDQIFLMPPSIRDWLPEGHLAHFISDVVDHMDLSAIYRAYASEDERGRPAYQPAMLVKLLLYAYCTGKPSSRKIEKATYQDVAYRVLAANQHPDHDTISDFRRRHLPALAALFVSVLELCRKAGLVKLGHVALDGSKVKANASKHKAMSYDRMCETEKKLEGEVAKLLEQAEAVDAAEDQEYGKGKTEGDLPAELARRESRLAKIREAKQALEEEAKARAQAQAQEAQAKIEERKRHEQETGKKETQPPTIGTAGKGVTRLHHRTLPMMPCGSAALPG
jgi:transposase